ncbi:MAG: leucine-rich repeat protein, partial [Christensenellales bacterium]
SQKVIYAQIEVVVQGEAKQLPRLNKISLLPTENGKDYVVSLEGTLPKLEMNPNGKASLRVKADPWYMSDLDLEWSSMDDTIASVDAIGTVFAHRKGTTIISVSVVGNATVGKSITVSVGDDYRIINYTLYDYYGGAECVIPDSKNVMMLDEECFQYNKTLKKVVFPTTLTEIPEKAFLGCENLEEIVVPSQCIVIHKSAFEGCGKLKKITFGKFVDKDKVEHPEYTGAITIGENAFKDCKSLSVIENSKRITTVGDGAFENCIALTEIDLTELRVTGKRAFAGCTALTTVATDSNTGVGEEMFFGCSSVTNFDFYGNYVSQGAFYGCSSLNSFRFFSDSFAGIGKSAFAGASSLTGITLPDGEYTIEAGAFANCTGLKYVELSDGTVIRSEGGTPFNGCSLFGAYRVNASNANYSVEDGVLYNKDKTVLVAVPVAKTSVSVPGDVTEIAAGAMSGVTALTSFDASGITAIGSYAFAGSGVVSVALSDGIVSLPEGIFSGCMKLTAVSGLGSVKTVEPYAFRNCAKLTSLSLPKAEYVGDGAFEKSGVTSVELPKVRTIGASAFEGSSIFEINLPESEIIGSRAFYNTKLRRASLGGITEMGEYVFVKSNDITDVVFSTGTKVVGDYAFFSTTERVALTTVVLPDGVEYIGKCAFVLCSALTEINVAETKEIGVMAFYGCKALENVDLHNAEIIGDNAFAKTALVSADLSNAVVIGEYAFSEAPLETVVFDKLKILGIGAFVETRLTSVTLPVSFGDRYYDYSWEVLDEKNRVEQVRHRNELAYGAGAFSYIDTLTEILVADGNNDFVSVDGVLYSRVGKGYVLEQYPTAKEGESYTVIDKTVAIGASAFEGVDGLEAITFPYTVKAIGSFAFYDSTVAKYTFNSVQAPVLYAEAINGDAYSGAEQGSDEYYIYLFFGSNGVGGTHYYANFYDFVAKKIYLLEEYRPEFKLTLTVPKNGKGYDSNIWEGFFETVVVTDEILPDDVTHEAIEAINGIDMTPDEIAAAADMAALTEISAKVKAARIAFNKITGSDQLSLAEVKAAKEVLLGAEKALRDRKEALGYPVAVEKLVLSAIPDKIKYVEGEEFDATGMIITVIFEDLSEMAVTDYTVNKSVLSLDDESVIVSYVKNGVTYTVEVKVNVVAKEGGDVVIDDGGKKGLSKTEIIIICVVCGTAACAGIAVAVVLIVLKKKGRFGKKTANDKNAEDDTAAADGEEKENGENVGCSETEEKE